MTDERVKKSITHACCIQFIFSFAPTTSPALISLRITKFNKPIQLYAMDTSKKKQKTPNKKQEAAKKDDDQPKKKKKEIKDKKAEINNQVF